MPQPLRIKSSLFIGLIITCCKVLSQGYIPLPMQNCYWLLGSQNGSFDFNTSQSCSYSEIFMVFPQNDTAIGSKTYVKFYRKWISGSGSTLSGPPCTPYAPPTNTLSYLYAVRQDTLNKKLYMVWPSTSAEKLMFDFNQVAGDTVKAVAGDIGSTPPGGTTQYRIIDSVYYRKYSDGNCYKVYKLKPFANSVNYVANSEIIEGYGNEIGLVDHLKSAGGGSMTYSTWQTASNATLVVSGFTITPSSPNTCGNIGIKETSGDKIDTYPNPVTDKLIVNGFHGDLKSISLITLTGTEMPVKFTLDKNKVVIDTESLPSAVYFLKIETAERIITKKIIKVQPD